MRNGRTRCARTVGVYLALAFASGTPAASSADTVIQRIGVNHAKLSWSESAGIVDGYLIYTRRNGGPRQYEAHTASNQFTLTASFGDEVVVEVRALGRNSPNSPLVVSSFSDPSQPIRFVPAQSIRTSAVAVMRSDQTDDVRVHLYERANSLYRFPGRAAPWTPIAAGDFNGDPHPEILWRNEASGALQIADLAGASNTLAGTAQSGLGHVVRGTGDLDGDGDLDLLVDEPELGRVRMWSVTASGSIEPSIRFDGLSGANVVGIADLDGDGAEDVWTREPNSGVVSVFRADGRGTPFARFVVPGLGTIEHVADFQGDGVPDLLWRTPSQGFALSYLGANLKVERTVAFPGTEYDADLEVSGAGGFVTETRLDLVLRNRRDGSMWLFLPSYEIAQNRFKILDSNGEGWIPFEILR